MKIKHQKMKNNLFLLLLLIFTSVKISAQVSSEITPPVYPGCEQNTEKMRCMRKKIINLIGENIDAQVLANIKQKPITVETSFTITKEGMIEINEINTQNEKLKIELLRVLSKIPPIKPAEENGIPVGIQYKLPLVFE